MPSPTSRYNREGGGGGRERAREKEQLVFPWRARAWAVAELPHCTVVACESSAIPQRKEPRPLCPCTRGNGDGLREGYLVSGTWVEVGGESVIERVRPDSFVCMWARLDWRLRGRGLTPFDRSLGESQRCGVKCKLALSCWLSFSQFHVVYTQYRMRRCSCLLAPFLYHFSLLAESLYFCINFDYRV